jgi:hypothetical protein
MSKLEINNQDYESRVRNSFEQQQAMRLIGATLRIVKSEAVKIVFAFPR